MRSKICKLLLKALNWLNPNPNQYAFIDNINFFSKEFIESLDK